MRSTGYSDITPAGVPLLAENDSWEEVMLRVVPKPQPPKSIAVSTRVFEWMAHLARPESRKPRAPDPTGIAWIPAARYRQFWPRMPAFALPAYYDGRVRINLEGREAEGLVAADKYEATCEQTIDLLRRCRNLLTGEEVVDEIHWPKKSWRGRSVRGRPLCHLEVGGGRIFDTRIWPDRAGSVPAQWRSHGRAGLSLHGGRGDCTRQHRQAQLLRCGADDRRFAGRSETGRHQRESNSGNPWCGGLVPRTRSSRTVCCQD